MNSDEERYVDVLVERDILKELEVIYNERKN